jgi:hypothetical protein
VLRFVYTLVDNGNLKASQANIQGETICTLEPPASIRQEDKIVDLSTVSSVVRNQIAKAAMRAALAAYDEACQRGEPEALNKAAAVYAAVDPSPTQRIIDIIVTMLDARREPAGGTVH